MKIYQQEFDLPCDESEQYSRCLCLRVKNIKKSESETSEVVLESIRKLFYEANAVILDAYIDLQSMLFVFIIVGSCYWSVLHRACSQRFCQIREEAT